MTAQHLHAARALAIAAGAVTVLLTGAAFWLSFEHLHDIAARNGLPGVRAWAWPGAVDLFIVAGELLILRASLRGRVDWFAYALAAVGSLGSIALNVAGVGSGASVMRYVVAAVPPSAALIAFGALMRQVHAVLVGQDAAAETEPAAVPEPAPELVPAVPEPVPELDSAPEPEAEPTGGMVPGTFPEHVRAARRWLRKDPGLSGAAIGRRLGASDSYGRRVRRAAAPKEATA
jgi:hypothetical protein